MSREFYWEPEPCPTCGHAETLSIGTSAVGWTFALRAHEQYGLTTWAAWKEFLKGAGRITHAFQSPEPTYEEFVEIVEKSQGDDRDSVADNHPDRWTRDAAGYTIERA